MTKRQFLLLAGIIVLCAIAIMVERHVTVYEDGAVEFYWMSLGCIIQAMGC